jgi:hypothetical protein
MTPARSMCRTMALPTKPWCYPSRAWCPLLSLWPEASPTSIARSWYICTDGRDTTQDRTRAQYAGWRRLDQARARHDLTQRGGSESVRSLPCREGVEVLARGGFGAHLPVQPDELSLNVLSRPVDPQHP